MSVIKIIIFKWRFSIGEEFNEKEMRGWMNETVKNKINPWVFISLVKMTKIVHRNLFHMVSTASILHTSTK